MKQIFMTTLILAALVFAQITNGQDKAGRDNAKLEAEIGKVLREYYDAFSRRDIAAAASIYTDDGFVFQDGYSSNLQIKADVRVYLQSPMAAKTKDTYEIEDLKVLLVNKDSATANYTVISKIEQNGKTDVRRDRTTNVLVRRAGRWQIFADHTSRLPDLVEPTTRGLPVGWLRKGSNNGSGYSILLDTNIKHGGQASATIKFTCDNESGFGSLAQAIAADDYRGKRVRLSGWLKTENADSAALWMRLDGNRRLLGFDNMDDRPVIGTTDWKQFELVLDVPNDTVNIVFGTLISGKGEVWVDDFKLEIVGQDVRSTNLLSPEQMRLDDPNRNPKKSDIKQPVNLGFENGTIP